MTKDENWYHIREIEEMISHWTGINQEEILYRYNSDSKKLDIVRPEEIITSSTDHIVRMLTSWDDHFIYDTETLLDTFVPLMRHIQDIVKQTAVDRRKSEKLVSK